MICVFVLPKCTITLASCWLPPFCSVRNKPGVLNASVPFTAVAFLGNRFHMDDALRKRSSAGLSVDSEFPNFMNNFLTIRPIRPWHPVPGTVAESPPRTQFNLAQAEPRGAPKGRLGTVAKQAAWANSAAVFQTLGAQWCQADSVTGGWSSCCLLPKKKKQLAFPSWEP